MPPAPLRRKPPGPEEKVDCDCCEADCDCADCKRCREAGIGIADDWIPPPAKGDAGTPGPQRSK